MEHFELISEMQPCGDQPKAIDTLVQGVGRGQKHQVLLGVTGSGKTFTVANVIARTNKPTLVLAHNKTLAAQLHSELKELFPHNAVHYFVSYYDYYQPEAYVPSTDTFIEKDARINDEIDRMRHSATRSLLERRDVIIVASVSCIYGIGSVESYQEQTISLKPGMILDRDDLLERLVDIQFERNDYDFHRGTFRVRGDIVEIFPPDQDTFAIRVEFFGDEIESIFEVDPLRGIKRSSLPQMTIYPASHYVVEQAQLKRAISSIREELRERLIELESEGKLLERERLEQRTSFDLEQLEQFGRCNGIEHYSRHLTGRATGEPPPCLLDYFPSDWLLIVDESHVTLPQVGGMYKGDRSRKMNLVEYGFRLPSALDNRPLTFEEFESRVNQAIYISATPAQYELDKAMGVIVEQIIRPTGLLDPLCEVRPASTQVDDLLGEIKETVARGLRVLVTTLTKRMAEDFTDYLGEIGVNARYLHADIDTLERTSILRDLRLGEFDVLVGINLLREGLDLPEVGLVAILDADKEGFLRNQTSLIQTIGRAARNAEGRVLLYADNITKSIEGALKETNRRRELQAAYNEAHHIVPRTVKKKIFDLTEDIEASGMDEATFKPGKKGGNAKKGSSSARTPSKRASKTEASFSKGEAITLEQLQQKADALRRLMKEQAKALQFEEAALTRDALKKVELLILSWS